jgi:elongation factor P
MKISGVDIRPGNIIEYEGGIWRAVKIQHTQPGKGGAYMQVELKNLIDGRKNNVRFRSAETVERVRLDTKDFQFLFHDGDMLVFMDKENYEQVSLAEDLIGEPAAFLQDGMDVVMELYNERPISVQLPDQIEAHRLATSRRFSTMASASWSHRTSPAEPVSSSIRTPANMSAAPTKQT